MQYFPIFIDLQDQKVIVIGGGETAAQKVRLLLKTGAIITIIAPALTPELEGLEASGKISVTARNFRPSDLNAARLVYAATGERATDRSVSAEAHRMNIPVNVVDDRQACSFITPAIVDRSPVVVAISTEGTAPVLAAQIKSQLEAMLPAKFGALARFAARLRPMVAMHVKNAKARRHFWQRFFKSRARNLILDGREADAWQAAGHAINKSLKNIHPTGRVSLVGVGAGNPDLLTLKAQQRLQEADVIVLDGLVNPEILEYARRDARRLYVGKTPGQSCVRQSEINAAMARHALDGSSVIRLQGGDALHFSRNIKDLEPLEKLGIEIEIVPGAGFLSPVRAQQHAPGIHNQTIPAKGF